MDIANDSEFSSAISKKKIQAYLQPIANLESGKFQAIEVRARWTRPTGEILTAKDVVGTAAELQQELALDVTMLRLANEVIGTMRKYQTSVLQIAINVCVNSLINERFIDEVENLLLQHEALRENVTLEIPAKAVTQHLGMSRMAITRLNKLNFKFSLDHVTDVSQIEGMELNLPIHSVKLDESLVAELPEESAQAKVAKIIAQAHAEGWLVGAEGIRNLAQLDVLRRLRCNEGQGPLIGRPDPIHGLLPLLNKGHW
jgi:EAL domain-containing protein (putative c-di-GMP-specific phosphodiesterase class I)